MNKKIVWFMCATMVGLILNIFFGNKAVCGEKEILVLRPIETSSNIPESEKEAMEASLKQMLQKKYQVFSGSEVIDKLNRVKVDENCGVETCLRELVRAFNAELIGYATITRDEDGYLTSLSIKDVYTGRDVFNDSESCAGCTKFKALDKIKALGGKAAGLSAAPVLRNQSTYRYDESIDKDVPPEIIVPQYAGNANASTAPLKITTVQDNVEVYAGNKRIGTTPLVDNTFSPNPALVLSLKKDGFKPRTIQINLKGGVNNEVANIHLESIYGKLSIQSEPSGARVIIDGWDKGLITPCTETLTSGPHVLTIKKDMYHSAENVAVAVESEKTVSQSLTLKPNFGYLILKTDPPGVTVLVSGKDVGRTPFENYPILSGIYSLELKKDLYFPVMGESVEVEDEKTVEKSFKLSPNFGTLEVESEPGDALVRVTGPDGRTTAEGQAPMSCKLPPETYEVAIIKQGYDTARYNVTLKRGRTSRIEKSAASLRLLQGYVTVTTSPAQSGMGILVNGEKKGTTPDNLILPEGAYDIRVISDTHEGSESLTAKDGDKKNLAIAIYPRHYKRNTLEVVVGFSPLSFGPADMNLTIAGVRYRYFGKTIGNVYVECQTATGSGHFEYGVGTERVAVSGIDGMALRLGYSYPVLGGLDGFSWIVGGGFELLSLSLDLKSDTEESADVTLKGPYAETGLSYTWARVYMSVLTRYTMTGDSDPKYGPAIALTCGMRF